MSLNIKPVADTEVLISLIAATNEVWSVVPKDARSPVSVAWLLKVVLIFSKLAVVATDLTAFLLS